MHAIPGRRGGPAIEKVNKPREKKWNILSFFFYFIF